MDPDGEAINLPPAAVGAIVGGLGAGLFALIDGKSWGEVGIAITAGAIAGGLAGFTLGVSAAIAGSTAIGMKTSASVMVATTVAASLTEMSINNLLLNKHTTLGDITGVLKDTAQQEMLGSLLGLAVPVIPDEMIGVIVTAGSKLTGYAVVEISGTVSEVAKELSFLIENSDEVFFNSFLENAQIPNDL